MTMNQSLPGQSNQQSQVYNADGTKSLTKKLVQTKTFGRDKQKSIETFNKKLQKADVPPQEPVYMYAGQKNNWYEKQMSQMRSKIAQDKSKAVYTMSADYLSLSIDPKAVDEEAKKDKELSQSKMFSHSKPFSSLLVKTQEERMALSNKLK